MLNEADLVQRYPDLLSGEVDPELARLVGDLDEAGSAYRAIEPPATLLAAIDQLASDHADEQRPRILVPRGFADAKQSPIRPVRDTGMSRDSLPSQTRRRWLRQSTEMAAGILALVLFAVLFVTLLSHTGSLPGTAEPGAQTTPATPNTPLGMHESPLDIDPEVRKAYDDGLGQTLNLTQNTEGFTVTLNWAYAQSHWIYVYYTIKAPPGQVYEALGLMGIKAADDKGNILPRRNSLTSDVKDGTVTGIEQLDASWVNAPEGIATLRLQSPGVGGLTPGDSNDARQRGVDPTKLDGMPDALWVGCQSPCSYLLTGTINFDFSMPFEQEAQIPDVTPAVTREQAIEKARSFLGEPSADLHAQWVDRITSNPMDTLILPPGPPAKYWKLARPWKNGEVADTFYMDANTRNLIKADIPSRAATDQSQTPMDDASIRTIAEDFAQSNYPGFDRLTLVEANNAPVFEAMLSLIGPPTPDIHTSPTMNLWGFHSAESGSWLPAFVYVSVDRFNGSVISYVARPVDKSVQPEEPLVNRERAIQIALEKAGTEPQNIGVGVEQIELVSQPARTRTSPRFSYLWSVKLTGTSPVSPGGIRTTRITIDARTGEIRSIGGGTKQSSPAPA